MPKQKPTTLMPPQPIQGESEIAYKRRLSAFLRGDDVTSKVDLKEWTGCPPFHVAQE